ncbi:hypothetical protein [Hyphomicrobium sp.]|uniref:hypothetical protein n=1 Tax=Hyphomicrobium sp. TaxID=82 RepID=UPI002FE35F29
MTREEAIALIMASDNAEFRSEVDYLLDVDREYPYDAVDAALDALDRAEGWVRDGSSPGARAVLRGAREALIAIGFFRPMADEEVENTFTSSGRAPWAFKLKGVAYTSDDSAEEWMSAKDEDDSGEE